MRGAGARCGAAFLVLSARLCAADAPCDPAGALFPIGVQSAGAGPHGIAIADFNGDGVPDVAVANSNYPPAAGQTGTVSIHFGIGAGRFGPGTFYAAPGEPFHLVAGDFDLDGIKDIVCASYVTDSVALFRGKGPGTFYSPISYAAGKDPTFALASDLDGDHHL